MEHKISLLKRAGESAFPVKMDMGDGSRIEGMGMSPRDYFAAKAMQGDWSCQNGDSGYFIDCVNDDAINKAGELYYRMADAMLRAREEVTMSGHPHADLMAKAAEIGIPEPVLELPECGDTLWIADITYAEAVHITWHESKTNLLLFSLGMLHTTKEAAEAHVAALLSFTQK